MKSTEALLQDTPLFRGVDLYSLVPSFNDWLRFYADKQVLFHEGETSTCLVVIVHGRVSILSEDNTNIQTRQAPEIIGEIAICGGPPCRTATVIASGSVRVLEIPYAAVESLKVQPTFKDNLLEILSKKLSESTSERAVHYSNENKLIAAFSSHLSPALTAELLRSGESFGSPRLIRGTILFADIRGFTDTSQKLAPSDLAQQLGAYLENMVDILHAHGAFVDKFIGDAIMAFWGLPHHSEMDPSIAFRCAEQMLAQCSTFRLAGEPIQIGVGLAAGEIFCGNVGSLLKRQFTVLGSAVNLSARCESLCKDLNAWIVMSEEVHNNLTTEQKARCSLRPWDVKGMGELPLHIVSRE